jgi:hypothetical protein
MIRISQVETVQNNRPKEENYIPQAPLLTNSIVHPKAVEETIVWIFIGMVYSSI